ncbi:pseudouridine synthase [Mesorhizobium sp. NBSH29]|uniref:pseudouridine synthase n=1 Tax=Mesorhizobium sp. NBSH29 TaxID=2654249 RepID=UPI001896606E|nr:pseudouridine synthase [Mesorhizobium sp. NBSH29]QPC86858.1 pseudouridine synthase [Mesorhizobium sp. NBSH29]
MDDDRKKGPRKFGPKKFSGPARSSGDAPRPARSGKPAFGAKPAFAGGGAKKPYQKREGAPGEARSDKPRTPFRPRDDRPRDDKPREFRPREADDKPRTPFRPRDDRPRDDKPREFRPREAGDKPRTPFRPRDDKPREFRPRDDRPRDGGDKPRPFRARDDSPRDGDKKPFRAGPRPERGDFEKRPPRRDEKPFERSRDAVPEEGERIAKRLARAGIASRRDAEELIAAGRIRVNGRVLASPAINVSIEDKIELDGTLIPAIERTRMFLFHKPAGVVTTNRDPQGRKTVFDVLPGDLPRLMTVGRLDINTEGLLLLTNDGGLSRVLELPATGWLRRYRVRVHGTPDEKALADLKNGISVDGVFYGAIEATLDRSQGSNAWLTIGLREGKNREVKNVLGALGLDVTRLIRVSYGPFQLGELPEGHVWEMKGKTLRDQLGERLIEESGANFEADIVNPFSNQPTRREREPEEEMATERPKIMRDGERGHIGEGGLIKARKRRENTRDDALGKLSTSRPERGSYGDKPDRGGKPAYGKPSYGDKPDRGSKPAYGKPSYGDKPDRGDKPSFGKPAAFGDRPDRDARPPRGKKPEREQRPIDPPGQRRANVWMASGARPQGKGKLESEKAEVDARKADKSARYGKKPFGKSDNHPAPSRNSPTSGPRKGKPGADRRR